MAARRNVLGKARQTPRQTMRTSYIALTAAPFLVAAASTRVSSSPRGLEDSRADFDAGDYSACLRKVASQLSSNTVRRDLLERHDLACAGVPGPLEAAAPPRPRRSRRRRGDEGPGRPARTANATRSPPS